ncbi:MAG TPA: hypothetical protein PKD53_16590 [Chloroflexaceae bacterium]|nr:hypothetical protein [Chloroflexaceae bacterium]
MSLDHAATVEYSRAAGRGRLGALTALLVLVALLAGAPGLFAWLPAALAGAPLAALAATALFTLPGLAALRLLAPGALGPAERFAAAVGLSCAAPPLLLLLADLAGLAWGPALCWIFLALCAAVALWPCQGAPLPPRPAWPDPELALLLTVTGLALAVRLYAARGLPAGLFGDSYHHTVISQLLIDNGGLFRSWAPYAPLTTLTYHFGFHSLAAWLSWLSGAPARLSVVAVGQILGALAAPGVFLLARRLLGDGRPALWGALVVALLSVFPAYFVNWGRYTQLAGQTVLPATCLAWMLLIDRATAPETRWRELARPASLAALATAGVALSHYRIAVFAALFVLLYSLYALAARARSWRPFARVSVMGALAGTGGLLLTLPWLLRIRDGQMLRLAGHFIANNIGTDTGNDQSVVDMERAIAHGLLPLAVLGLVWIVARRRWAGLLLPLWAGAVWLAANPFLLGLTGAGIISSFTAVLAAYLVLCPLAGAGLAALFDGLAWLAARAAPAFARAVRPLELLAAAAIAAWGLGYQARVVDPGFQLLAEGDLAAAQWVREHVPPDARVFVNSFPAYAGSVYVGTDGGWWLPFLSGRRTNLDPISYGFEAAEEPGYMQLVIDRNRAVLDHPADSPEAAAALRAGGYAYLYDGPAANPADEYLDPARLDASPLYERVYGDGGVTIWRVR